ncbi:MAG: SAF domain-containing protein [Acidimicrobiia bacterium]|nr:SAF domain-containing protein [Acidimicrobiia bacterium]
MTTAQDPYPKPSTPAGLPAANTIARRRGLPTGRAVLGALLVAVAAIGLFVAYREAVGEPDTDYVILEAAVEPGERITAADVRIEAIDLPPEVGATAFTSIDQVVGAVAITPLASETIVPRDNVLLLAPGEEPESPPWREMSFGIGIDHAVDGRLRPGERIDMIATYSTQSEAETVVVFRDAPVLRVSEGEGGVLSSTDGLVITVALVDPAEVLATINAVDDADEITVIRATKASDQVLPDSYDYEPSSAEE